MKIVRAVLEIYASCIHGQTDKQAGSPIFYKVETYLDRLLMLEKHIIPNLVKILIAVLEIYESCIHGQADRQATLFFIRLRPI